METRCMKCKKKVEPIDTTIVSMNNPKQPDKKGMKGKCPECGTTTFRILPKDAGTNPNAN